MTVLGWTGALQRQRRPAARPPRPDPAALSGPLSAASFVAGVAAGNILADGSFPRPGSDAEAITRYFDVNAGPARISVAGQLVSAVALARFTASAAALARRSGRHSRSLRTVTIAGGGLAAGSLTAAALHAAALTVDPGKDLDRAVKLHRRMFLAGGPIHGLGFGLLVGALGQAGLRTGEIPGRLSLAGLAVAVPNILSPLYLVAEPAAWLIPAGRLSGLIVTSIAGALLSRDAGAGA
jgi:hypothetical protein